MSVAEVIASDDKTQIEDYGIFVHKKTAARARIIVMDGVVHPFNPETGDLIEKVIDELNPRLHEITVPEQDICIAAASVAARGEG